MQTPEPPPLPLQFTAELLLDISTLRDECVNVARVLANSRPVPDLALEQCARLDDALAASQRALQSAFRWIKNSRAEQAR